MNPHYFSAEVLEHKGWNPNACSKYLKIIDNFTVKHVDEEATEDNPKTGVQVRCLLILIFLAG